MDEQYKMKKEFCVSSLSVQISDYDDAHHFETRSRKIHNSIGYIEKGRVEISTLTERIVAKEGDLIFIPEGIRYVSHWDGQPKIRFCSVHFLMQQASASIWRSKKLQIIEGAPIDKMKLIIEQMLDLSQGDDIDHLKVYGKFYELMAMVLPVLTSMTTSQFPRTVQMAITYIENNYATITSVQEIASACYLSESRLYHLFKEHLRMTPISYLNKLRVHSAIEMLKNTDLSISEIGYSLNFHSDYYFRETFKKITGVLPSHFRKML